MRIYNDALEMIKEVERDLAEMGIRYQSYSVQDKIVKDDPNYMTLELMGYAYKLIARNGIFMELGEMLEYKKDRKYIDWVNAEAFERLDAAQNPGTAWIHRKDFWLPFLKNGKFSYTYSERWQEQLRYIIPELGANPESRQVIITMYDRHQDMMNWRGLDRVPCSLTYQFLIRDKKLHCIYSMRSCDFVNFFQADVYCTIQLMNFIADKIDIEVGSFTHFLGSLHAFKKDLGGVF
ncbi:MAG: thymidylate synthase [Candidatus Heimdallarchaeaceae archaeon]